VPHEPLERRAPRAGDVRALPAVHAEDGAGLRAVRHAQLGARRESQALAHSGIVARAGQPADRDDSSLYAGSTLGASRDSAQSDIETAHRGIEPPSIEGSTGSPRRFVVAALSAAAALLAAAFVLNVVVDPWGGIGTRVFPSLVPTDRPVKAALIAKLERPPELVVFGSSRALKIDPAYLQRKLGQTGFNAGVSDGGPEDTWTLLSYIHQRFPQARPHFLWVLDVEAFRGAPGPGILNTPELAQFIPLRERSRARLEAVPPLLTWKAVRASIHVLRHRGSASSVPSGTVFDDNGYRAVDVHDLAKASGSSLASQLQASEALYSWLYRTLYEGLSPSSKRYFERTLAKMNAWGHPPVIVLSPIHPELRAKLIPLGWDTRHREVLAYLAELRKSYAFTFLDMTSLGSFGGSPTLFYDGMHLTLPNIERLLDAILRRAGSAL
jgi:hypothetical protein